MRRVVVVVLALALVLAVAVGGLLWRLSMGPLSLAWLQPTLEELVQRSSPFAVTFTDPSLVWEPSENLAAVQVRDVQALAEDGQLVASAPLLRGTIALGPLLLERRIALARMRVDLPKMGLTRGADDRLALLFDGKPVAVQMSETTDAGGLAALLGDAPGSTDPRLASLQLVEISAPVLQYEDAVSSSEVSATDALFTLTRDGEAWVASLSATVGQGRIAASSKAAATPPQQDITVELRDLLPSQLAAFAPSLPLGGVAVPLSGTIRFPIVPATGERGAASIDVTGRAGQVAAEHFGLEPIVIEEVRLRGSVQPGWQIATVDAANIVSDGFALSGSGKLGYVDGKLVADLTVEADDLDVEEIKRIWPTQVAKDARDWVAGHVSAGLIGGATLQAGQRSPRPGQQDLAGTLAFSGVQLRYLDTFPAADGLGGTASLAGNSLTIRTTGGRTGEVDLGPAQITLSNLLGDGVSQLKASLDLRSTLPAAMRLLDAKPIELGRQTGLSPDRASGRQATSLTLQLPLIDPLPESRIGYKASVRLTDVEIREVSPGYTVAADSFAATAQPSGVTAKGEARLNGVPLTVDFFQTEKPGADGVKRRATVAARVDQAAVERLGFTWPAAVGGSVGIDARIVERRSPMRAIELSLDLAQATLAMPELRLAKQRGQPGAASASLTQTDDTGLAIDRATLTLPGWTVEGSGTMLLDPPRPRRITLTRMRSPLGDLTADVFERGGVWRGQVDIGSLDVRPLLEGGSGQTAGAGSAEIPNFDIMLAARSLQLGETPLSHLLGSVAHQGGRWQSAALQGDIQGSRINLDLVPAGAIGRLTVRGADAGWVIRSIGTSDNGVRGGTFVLKADLDQSAASLRASGDLKIRDFTMWGAPTIARIFSLVSFSGLSSALSGQGVPVSRLIVPFRLRDDVVTLEVARLVASDIGARADGTIDIARQQLDISGTVAPAYTINRILGRIPIIGSLMSGRGSDAFLAATFRVRGPLDHPQVSVNPLAALVPGAIRDLFGGFDTDPNSTAE